MIKGLNVKGKLLLVLAMPTLGLLLFVTSWQVINFGIWRNSSLEKDLSIYFAVKGYVTQLKAKDKEIIAQVNVGRDLKVVEDQLFKVYVFEENEDPMSGAISCDVIETTTKLRASQQITDKTTWTSVESGNPGILKLGQLVQKTHEKAGFAIPKF